MHCILASSSCHVSVADRLRSRSEDFRPRQLNFTLACPFILVIGPVYVLRTYLSMRDGAGMRVGCWGETATRCHCGRAAFGDAALSLVEIWPLGVGGLHPQSMALFRVGDGDPRRGLGLTPVFDGD